MKRDILHFAIATLVFVISLVQFLLTSQPSVSFWDAGEISAASYLLQVPHPPGAPLSLLLGRVFALLPLAENAGFRINVVSVLASAFSVLFLYFIAVKVIKSFDNNRTENNTFGTVGTYAAAAIGALAFSFSDTFWFNGVESEVFAVSTLLFAAITWIMMAWYEQADQPGSSRYLILIAYLIGLSAGVHLMSVLSIVSVVIVVIFRKYIGDEEHCKNTGYLLLMHIAVMFVVGMVLWSGQHSQGPPSPEEYRAFDKDFLLAMVGATAVWVLIFRKKIVNRNSIYIPFFIGGLALFVAYPGVIKLLPTLLVKVAGDSHTLGLVALIAIVAIGIAVAVWAAKEKKTVLHLASIAVIAAIVGFTTYAVILIRANADTPMNENSPKTFAGLVSYLNREQYGDWPVFQRRFSQEPHQQGIYVNYKSDLDFLWNYQMDHMFNRYLFWNFIGRESTIQDTGVDWKQYFGIPFFIGLLGIFFQFRKDWKMGTAFLVLFLLMGYLTAFYQNQQQSQPRERDYFYPGAFFVFALWIAVGVKGILTFLETKLAGKKMLTPVLIGVLTIATLFIPGRMLQANYFTHDRSQNWVPWDYSYNILQTCEKDAILFTNGDNDTFPLWYLQDVESVRRDVRIVNLSLVNTPWYIQQMKNKPYYSEAIAVPISSTNAEIEHIQPMAWESLRMDLPVPKEAIERYGVTDTAVTHIGKITFTFKPTLDLGNVKAIRVQDRIVQDIVYTNQWKRPIYFAATVSPDCKIGLDEYLWFHGLAWRLEPRRIADQDRSLDAGILEANLYNEPNGFSTTPQYGYKWRNIANPKVYFDENTSRLMINYRSAFIRLALYHANITKDNAKALSSLDRMEQLIPRSKIPMGWELSSDIASFYHRLGNDQKFNELVAEIEPQCQSLIASGQVNMSSYYNPYRVLLEIYDAQNEHAKGLQLMKQLEAIYPNDSGLRQQIVALEGKLASQQRR